MKMGEMVTSRYRLMLLVLENEDNVVFHLVKDEVNEFVLTLEKIEKLFNDDRSSRKVMDNKRKLRNLVYTIEDALEPLAVNMEVAFKPSKNEKKRGITGILIRKCFGRGHKVGHILLFMKSYFEVEPLITLLGEVVWTGDTDTDIEPIVEHMYDHGMEEHFVEMEENLLEKLVEKIASNDKEHWVFSILGAKGLGKTTLARNVYTHHKTRSYFKAFAWVSFRQDHQINNLLQSILDKLNAGAEKNAAKNKANLSEVKAIKKNAKEHKKAAEDKNESAEEQEKGADEKNKAEGADEKKKEVADENKKVGADEKKEGVGARAMNHLHNMMKRGAGRKSAEDKNESAEEHKKGAHEKKEGGEEQPKSSEKTVMDKLKNILKSSVKTVMDKLKNILKSESRLIVIDGISESQWNDISSKFPTDFALTKFLLTTETKIAGVEELYEMKHLNDDKGWELLKKYAFHGKKAPVLSLVRRLGKEMVGKCGGIPSTITILGRNLREKQSLREWHEVYNDIEKFLNSKDPQSLSSNDLILSYDSLSYYQKECFLYLAIFKEDECVDPEDVSFLWIAEGFCSPQQQKQMTVMDTTEEYLQVLASMLHMQVDELSRKRFMPFPCNNYIYARELSLHLGNKEDFRLKVVDFSGGKQPRFDPYTLSDERTRRLVIHFNRLSSPMEQDMNATDDLRSLLFLNPDREYVNLPVKISDFSEFMLLRVLHFVRCKFEGKKLPKGIVKLLNLRYLGILYCDLESLPSSITNVRNLHILNVRAYIPITIPNFESEMSSLKHLRLPHNSKHEQETPEDQKLKLNGLLHLETLDGFNADIHDHKSLSKLEKLRHLSTHAYSIGSLDAIIEFVNTHGARIRTNLVIESKCDLTSPDGMFVLEEVLLCPNLYALTFSMVVLRMFPNFGNFASKQLTQIKLIGCKLSEDPMEALEKFPNLRKLWLVYGAFVGTKMAIRDGGFPNLEYLEFRCLPNLEEWTVDKGAMKKLSTLIVRKCPKLKTVSDGLEIDEQPPTALAEGVWLREKSQHQDASCSFTSGAH